MAPMYARTPGVASAMLAVADIGPGPSQAQLAKLRLLLPFVCSFVANVPSADLVLFGTPLSALEPLARAHPRVHVLPLPGAVPPEGVQSGRYAMYSSFMHGSYGADARALRRVAISDSFDVIFQADPFERVRDDGHEEIQFFLEKDGYDLNASYYNRLWLETLYGVGWIDPIIHRTVSCSGFSMGTSGAMRTYLAKMAAAVTKEVRPRVREFRKRFGWQFTRGYDQGVHNRLVLAEGGAADAGTAVRTVSSTAGIVLTANKMTLGEHFQLLGVRLVSPSGVLYAAVHQHNRVVEQLNAAGVSLTCEHAKLREPPYCAACSARLSYAIALPGAAAAAPAPAPSTAAAAPGGAMAGARSRAAAAGAMDARARAAGQHSLEQLRTWVISLPGERTKLGRAALFGRAAEVNLTDHLAFVDAVDGSDARAVSAWLGGKNFSHVKCAEWRDMAHKKIVLWASAMRALERAAATTDAPSLLLEDDVVFRPNPRAFRQFVRTVLAALSAPDARGSGPWDVVFLGSCLEQLDKASPCYSLGGGLFLSLAYMPVCGHALLLSPQGARRMLELLRGWGEEYHKRTRELRQPTDCAKAANTKQRGERMAEWWKMYEGKDQYVKWMIKLGKLDAYHVWPQLIFQQNRLNDHRFTYWHKLPASCSPTAATPITAERLRAASGKPRP